HSRRDSLLAWNDREVIPSERQQSLFQRVGGIGAIRGDWRDFIQVPCRAVMKSGSIHDAALVVITRGPLYQLWSPNGDVHDGDEALSFTESTYALPFNVRRATTMAKEVNNGFAPTRVQSVEGRIFYVQSMTSFFSYGDHKGRDMSLYSDTPADWGK